MKFDFSRTDNAARTMAIALNTVYTVQADSSYNAFKNLGKDNKDLVVIRTVKGRGNVEIDGFDSKIIAGDTLLAFEHNSVRRYYCSENAWDFWWFEFSIIGTPVFPLNTVMQVEPVASEEESCIKCLNLLRGNNMSSKALASAILNVLIYQWMYIHQDKRGRSNPHHQRINTIISHMHSNLSKNVTVAEMAAMAGLSERRFRQVFKALTGIGPKKYYDELRMKMAKELLENTSLSIAEISYELGYSSQFHFSRAFKKHFRLPPSES